MLFTTGRTLKSGWTSIKVKVKVKVKVKLAFLRKTSSQGTIVEASMELTAF
jgi:hypothetical protein